MQPVYLLSLLVLQVAEAALRTHFINIHAMRFQSSLLQDHYLYHVPEPSQFQTKNHNAGVRPTLVLHPACLRPVF